MERSQKKTCLDCVVIGAGPAGLSASIYLKRAGLNFVVFEKDSPCSKLFKLNKLENLAGCVSSPSDLALTMFKQARKLDIIIKSEGVKNILKEKNKFKLETEKGFYYSKSVILASGVLTKIKPIYNYERFLGKGVSSCVSCDGYFFKNKNVAYCDYTEDYFNDVLYLSRICRKILIFGKVVMNSKVKTLKNVEIHNEENLISLNGNGSVNSISTDKKEYKIDGIFFPNLVTNDKPFYSDLKLKKGSSGLYFDNFMKTSCEGVFVCGDLCNRKLKQISIAIGDGAVAANSVIGYIK